MDLRSRISKRFQIGLSANGYVFIRDRADNSSEEFKAFAKNALPTYSTDTRAEADAIIVRECRLARDNSRYIWPDFPEQSLSALEAAGERMAATHAQQKLERKQRTRRA